MYNILNYVRQENACRKYQKGTAGCVNALLRHKDIMQKKLRHFYSKHPDISAYIIISAVFLLLVSIVLIFKSQGGIWGSDKDWKSQHFAIPEYFRIRFYETHDPFPDLALQLGNGQNIYNYAYYGIFNPLYLPSYALPFIKMSTYIQFLSLTTVLVSSMLSYILFKRRFDRRTALILAILFLCSGGLMFHSHRHVMFMNYIPFLLGMLLICEKKDSPARLFLMALFAYCIMCCSFYFSVSSFATVAVYMIYIELSGEGRPSIASVFSFNWKKVTAAAAGCLCSSFLWMPVLAALLSGRAETSTDMSLISVLCPTVNLSMLLHTGYSVGVTSVAVFAALYLIVHGRRQDRFLAAVIICCAVFPLINYIINAGMYIDGKAFIPLTVPALIVCGEFFNMHKKAGKDVVILLVIHVLMVVISLVFCTPKIPVMVIMIVEYAVTTPVLAFILFKGKEKYIPGYTLLMTFAICIAVNMNEKFVTRSSINEFYSGEIRSAISETIDSDSELFRFGDCIPDDINVNRVVNMRYLSTNSYSSVSNSALRDFRFNTSLSENRIRNTAIQNQSYSIIFNALMGCRYRIAPEEMRMDGEVPVNSAEGYTIFRNDYAFPLGYASENTMSETEFYALPLHLRAEALIENIIIPEKSGNSLSAEHTEELDFDMSPALSDKRITGSDGVYTIKSDENFTVHVPLEKTTENKFLVVIAQADNRIGDIAAQTDVALTINGVKNKLTDPKWKYNNHNYDFTFVISSYEPVSELEMIFTKGYYRISGLHVYAVDTSVLSSAMENKDTLMIDTDNSLGDTITGDINVSKDGWFTFSLPYDKGFSIKVDGEDTEYFRTNTAFIGFPVAAGEHHVEITFEAPLKKTGMKVSAAGAAILAVFIAADAVMERKRKDR